MWVRSYQWNVVLTAIVALILAGRSRVPSRCAGHHQTTRPSGDDVADLSRQRAHVGGKHKSGSHMLLTDGAGGPRIRSAGVTVGGGLGAGAVLYDGLRW